MDGLRGLLRASATANRRVAELFEKTGRVLAARVYYERIAEDYTRLLKGKKEGELNEFIR